MTFADWIRGIAPVGGAFVATLVVGGLGIWLYGLVLDRRDRRVDDALRAQVNAPPPPHVSPFATPRARSETSPQVTAEGEVKP